jgi:hypothetical protein
VSLYESITGKAQQLVGKMSEEVCCRLLAPVSRLSPLVVHVLRARVVCVCAPVAIDAVAARWRGCGARCVRY